MNQMLRRTAIDMALDQQRILDHVRASDLTWVRREPWMRKGDIDALIRKGALERDVVNVMARRSRRRAYLRAL
jgi:hypothetical protein